MGFSAFEWRTGSFLLAGLLLLSGPKAEAQLAPNKRARIYSIAPTGEAARFQVPQVRLPTAAIARRINQQLLRYVINEFSSVDSTQQPVRGGSSTRRHRNAATTKMRKAGEPAARA